MTDPIVMQLQQGAQRYKAQKQVELLTEVGKVRQALNHISNQAHHGAMTATDMEALTSTLRLLNHDLDMAMPKRYWDMNTASWQQYNANAPRVLLPYESRPSIYDGEIDIQLPEE